MAWIVVQSIRGLRQRSNDLVRMYRQLKRSDANHGGLNWLRDEIREIEFAIDQMKKDMAALFLHKESSHEKSFNHLGEAEDFKDSLLQQQIIRKERRLSS
ncbi:hypothetical protein M3223_04280 [Paenibacillus pasadenensis]|uniref:hypothetical protein n=1 Tax=Paenibacillus pasadenensis TaxID=217090 RepID=UPI00203BF337|nr:hypothetical protein [Paenibacillus pasadenensis]MCM3746567.1 hypothetical protein [Paenibacillus pasadenensis]